MAAIFFSDIILAWDEQESKQGDVDASISYSIFPIVFHIFTLEFLHYSILVSTFYIDFNPNSFYNVPFTTIGFG